MDRASGTYGIIQKGLTLMSADFPKGKKENGTENNFEEIKAGNIPNLTKDLNFQIQKVQ